jgi:glucose-1-phosphate cytidylyltransferase
MQLYNKFGHTDFIVCLGYKGIMIKQYFRDFVLNNNNIAIFTRTYYPKQPFIIPLKGETIVEDWQINLVDTGEQTNTGGRILRVKPYIVGPFCLTYADGLTDVNINEIINFHKKSKKLVTFLAVKPKNKFGTFCSNSSGLVSEFSEKPCDANYINGGFFVCETEVFKYIKDDKTSWEFDVLPELVKDKQLMAYKYDGFWKSMDSLKDKIELEEMWNSGKAPWKIW